LKNTQQFVLIFVADLHDCFLRCDVITTLVLLFCNAKL